MNTVRLHFSLQPQLRNRQPIPHHGDSVPSEQPGRFSRAARAPALEGVCPHRLLHAALPQPPLRHACGGGVR